MGMPVTLGILYSEAQETSDFTAVAAFLLWPPFFFFQQCYFVFTGAKKSEEQYENSPLDDIFLIFHFKISVF